MNFNVLAKAGLTQTQFAEIVGVSRVTVNTWMSGKHRPAPHTRPRVAMALKQISAMVRDKQLPLNRNAFLKEQKAKLRALRARIDNELTDTAAV